MITYNVHADFSFDFCYCVVSTKLRGVEILEVRNSKKLGSSVEDEHPRRAWPLRKNLQLKLTLIEKTLAATPYE